MVLSSGGGPLRMPLGEHGASPFQNVRIPGIDIDGDGQSLVRDANGRSFAVPARMGLSSSMELPGMSLQENPSFPSSTTSELRCLMSSEVLSLDDSLHQDTAFTFESMDAPSPEAGEPQQFSETLNSLLGAYSLRGADNGSGMGDSASDGSRNSIELVTKAAPVDGTQSASALTRNVSRRSKSELSYAELLADPSPKAPSTGDSAPSAPVSELSPSTPMQRSPSSASVAVNASRAAASENDVRVLRKKRVSESEAEPEAEGPFIPSIVEVEKMLEAQQRLFYSQLDDLQKLITVQYSLTGTNPLSQEMAISVLGSEAVKKPKPSLVPEAVRLLRDVYAFKDTITKREARDLSVLTGATFAQVMDFFSTQQSRVKRIYQLAQEEAGRGGLKNAVEQSHVPDVNAVVTSADSFEKLLELMRSETSFTGQSRVIQIILDAEHVPFLRTFLEKGGLRILGKWLMQAVLEEQTTLVRDIVKALFHLPIVHALPAHVSPVFATVSKLRFYFAADVAGNARTLISRWNKQFVRKVADQPSSDKTEAGPGASQDGGKSNSLAPEKKKLKTDPAPVAPRPSIPKPPVSTSNMPNLKGLDNSEKPPATNLTVRRPMEDPAVVQANRKRLADLGKEKRKVLLVEEMGATGRRVRDSDGRKSSVADKGSRPLSADDIQKAKMRQRLLQGAPNAKFRKKEVSSNISSFTGRSPSDNTVTDTNARQGSPRLPEVLKPVTSPPQGAPTLPVQGQPLQTQPSQVQVQPVAAQPFQVEYQPAQAQVPQLPFQAPQVQLQASQGEAPQVQPVQFQTAQLQALQMHLQTSAAQLQFPLSSSRPPEFSQPTLREARSMDQAEADSATRGADAGEEPCVSDAVLVAELMKRAISWTVPPGALVDPEWKIAAGEDSRENEVQTMRVKREVEELNTDAESIPKDPKEPWEEEQDYDDSLTPEVPIDSEDGQDKDAAEEHMQTTTVAAAPSMPSIAKSAPGHDPQLLALLLQNPELVTELTSGKGLQGLTSLQQKPLPPPPPPPPAIDPKQLQQTLQGFGMPQAFQQQQQQPQQQYGGYRDATATSNDYPQGAQYYAHAGLGARDGFLGPSSNSSSSSSSSGSWAASSYFNKQPQQQPQPQQQGYYGGGNQQVWNNRVSNNNLAFAHQQQQHQQHPHHAPHHVHPPPHQSMDMRNNNHPLDASSRYQHHRAPHQQWYNGPPTRPPTGW